MQQIFNIPKKEVMDIYLQKTATEKGYIIKGLDSPEIQWKSLELLYGQMPKALKESADTLINKVKLLDETFKTKTINSDFFKNIKDFENAYKRQDLSGLEKRKKEQIDMISGDSSLSNIMIDQTMYFLIRERNFSWIEKIPKLISNQPTMIGVGACHLYGKDGLISLLRQRGYKLERVKN